MFKKILKVIEGLVTIWGFLAIVAIVFDALGWLPYYDIYYKRKTEIEPVVSVYPGAHIRLHAEFANTVDPANIENVVWTVKYSSGKEYVDLPGLRTVDISLLPDISGIVSLAVKAKLFEEDFERYGAASLHVAQSKPYVLSQHDAATFAVPSDIDNIDLNTVQLYEGDAKWRPTLEATMSRDRLHLSSEGQSFPVWDGKAYLRFKTIDSANDAYRYEALSAIKTVPNDP